MPYYGKSLHEGIANEVEFKLFMERRGWKVEHADSKQDMSEHWDFRLIKGDKNYTVDVKAKKRISRSDSTTQTYFIWVEILNVRGNTGWLYGKADFIAFAIDGGFSFIKRLKLVEVVEKLITGKEVYRSQDALYNLYTRRNRNDSLTMIKYSDIKEYCKEIVHV